MRVTCSRRGLLNAYLATAHLPGNKTGTASLKCSQGMPVSTVEEQVLLGTFDLEWGWIMCLSPHTMHWKINPLCSLWFNECRENILCTLLNLRQVSTQQRLFLLFMDSNRVFLGRFFFNHEHKGSETFSGNVFSSSAGCCLFSFLFCSMLISLALEFIAWRKVVNTKKAE